MILGADSSRRLRARVIYRHNHRVTDEEAVAALGSLDDLHAITGPPGTICCVDTSRCFHYGSRIAAPTGRRLVILMRYITPWAFIMPPDYSQAARFRRPVTLADGHVTIFGAIDHCTAECVGLHAAKSGTRFEALEPGRPGSLRDDSRRRGERAHDAPRLRQSVHEQRLLSRAPVPRHRVVTGLRPQPEGNGCIERFFRTLKEQLLWVRHFTDVEDLQQALRTFKDTYNQQWLIERLGFRALAVVRRAFALTPAA